MAVALAVALAGARAVAVALVRVIPGRGPGPGLGTDPRAIVEKSEMFKISKVLRMGLPIVENLSGLSGNIFSLSRIPQLHFN